MVCRCSYQSTLKQLFGERDSDDKSHSKLAASVKRIMQVLQLNLDGKAKLYKDPSLTQLFLMNNIHYMVKSVRRCVDDHHHTPLTKSVHQAQFISFSLLRSPSPSPSSSQSQSPFYTIFAFRSCCRASLEDRSHTIDCYYYRSQVGGKRIAG